MAGYNGLGIHKNIVSASSKLEDETLPKLNADLDVNTQSLMNIGWMESDNIGSNEVLLGQSTTPVEDYGITGVSWKTIDNKYFGAYAWYDSDNDEYVLQFSSPNPNLTPNSWMEFRSQVRYNIDLATLESLDNKALVNKEYVLSKLGVAKEYLIEDRLIIPANTSSANTFYKLNGLGDEIAVLDYANPTTNWQLIQRSGLMRANQIMNAYAGITTGYMSILSKDFRVAVGAVTLNIYVGDTITRSLIISQVVNFGINYYKIPLDLTGFGSKLYYNRSYIFYEIIYTSNVSSKTEMKIQLSFE